MKLELYMGKNQIGTVEVESYSYTYTESNSDIEDYLASIDPSNWDKMVGDDVDDPNVIGSEHPVPMDEKEKLEYIGGDLVLRGLNHYEIVD